MIEEDGPPLDDDQRRVAEADADERLVVVAGAGQGKTEVVASRLAHLIESEGLSASSELLVLSFSRAAVHAVRTRLADRETAEVNVRTFDSFASQLLLDDDIEPTGTFDDRIRQATRLLRDSEDVPDLIDELQHVIIDEVQDLVGDRADFVLEILAKLPDDAGLTILGDPLQGIYDFVLEDSKSATSFDEFYERLIAEHRAEQVSLARNYRARGDDCLRVIDLAPTLRELDDADAALHRLKDFAYTLPQMERVEDWEFVTLYAGRSAVLCRSNADVLRISRVMADQGIRHTVRRPAQSFGAARWIAPALADLPGPVVAQSDVESKLAEMVADLETDDAWYLLKGAEGSSRNQGQIDLGRLRNRIRSATVPLTLTQGDDAEVIVSTIHRAKGLEFNNVFIVDDGYDPDDDDRWARVRQQYVALTRARDNIVIVHPAKPRAWSVIRELGWLPNRLQECHGSRGKSRAKAIEFGPTDVYESRPTSAGNQSAADIQRVLNAVTPGQPVSGTLDGDRADIDYPVYTLTVDGEPIGRTSEDFGSAFATAFKIKPGIWPAEIIDLMLVSVESTAGDPRITEEAGVGPGGFWLVPRVVGLARPLWDVMEAVG
ncbi:MAG: helicase [Gordonia sp.]|uniref:UvrD-helicase domain-containing protein n=1 Tax=Gordonia sp. (in: high G+C Gram-positive bacteria) TaxID=84139 RepID=UPI000C4E52DB|nr:UvrD-helicase domain-containing protein [Gordonia sp. (in: high G+C Gram-positive bacteria)]MAU84677.1 helicase [Gordonia sp. (in: high G+C Gram-positive bacteria)]